MMHNSSFICLFIYLYVYLLFITMLIFTGGNSGAMFTLNETTGVLRTTRQAVSAVEIYDIVKYQFLTRAFKFITEAD